MPYGYQGKVRDIDINGYGQSSTNETGFNVLMMDGTMWTNGTSNNYQQGFVDNVSTYHVNS